MSSQNRSDDQELVSKNLELIISSSTDKKQLFKEKVESVRGS